jgi:pyridoxine 5-phosphate synthase
VIRLSVNVNKVATLRNSRGGEMPDILHAVRTCVAAGAHGITVHPRADQRHIRPADVRAIAAELAPRRDRVEFNIEGDPRPDLLEMVHELLPHQCTLVPVREGEVTSQGGWAADTPRAELGMVVRALVSASVRVAIFVDADPAPIRWAADLGAQRVELFTEPFARAFEQDLDRRNLKLFRELPHLDEVSIGHALISDALFEGLESVVRSYLAALLH